MTFSLCVMFIPNIICYAFFERRNAMNQVKIGTFLKELRKQKGLTQEQFAEIVNVSNRTVSRWENGYNLPDLDVLIELADYYEVDLREILDGERKGDKMNKDLEETILKTTDYTNTQTELYIKRVRFVFLISAIFWFVSQLINHTELDEIAVLTAISDFAEGVAIGMLFVGLIITSRYGNRIRAFKQRLLKRR